MVVYFLRFLKYLNLNSHFKGNSKGSVQIGPFPAIERIVAENRFLVLTRLTKAVFN